MLIDKAPHRGQNARSAGVWTIRSPGKLGPEGTVIHAIRKYVNWLHTRWPAGTVERLPQVNYDGSTNVSGLCVVGDLTGIPLLKFASDTGARAVRTIVDDPAFQNQRNADRSLDVLDLVIVGGGVSGMAAALEARTAGLAFELLEASEPFSTVVNFPKAKPIYTYPTEMRPAGDLQFTAQVKEDLLEELRAQTLEQGIQPRATRAELVRRSGNHLEVVVASGENLRARRVIVAIGRSGDFRRLGIPGEDKNKVYNRLHDPKDFCAQNVLVVGGGDSALETAIAIAQCGGHVTLSYRKAEFSRPKPENVERLRALQADPTADVAIEHPVSERITTSSGRFLGEHKLPGSIKLMMSSQVQRIEDETVRVTDADGQAVTLPNDVVFKMIGRQAPLDFFRRSGLRISGEMTAMRWGAFGLFAAFCVFLYHWKKSKAELPIYAWFARADWFPFNVRGWFSAFGEAVETPGRLLHVLAGAMATPSFYYTLAYSAIIVIFGIRRIKRRRTPYVTAQTFTLMGIQCVPLFLLPEILLPWADQNGWFDGGMMGWIADQLFPDGSYWRAYGLVLAWPLFIYNVFTDQPLWGWLFVAGVQTCVLIPLLVYYWGKGAYCGWICPCGALAETLGDTHRHKMLHGPFWNRLNMVGQVILFLAVALLLLRILGWIWPLSFAPELYLALLRGVPYANYEWFVDLLLAGILGVACYFWFSGRVWCRFACPLAALMHVYARFSRFRILAEKKKCISCNVCTSVCHQGIDVMNFANKGLPMQDPECVRCSACVQSCPTGVLAFGRIDPHTGEVSSRDRLAASRIRLTEHAQRI